MEDNLENQKRKAIATEITKATIIGHFSATPKSPTSPPILKEGRYPSLNQEGKDKHTKDKVCIELALSFLHLIINVPSDRDYVE